MIDQKLVECNKEYVGSSTTSKYQMTDEFPSIIVNATNFIETDFTQRISIDQ